MYKYFDYFKNHFSFILCSLILVFPLFLFDVNDYEEYGQGFYSVRYFYSSFNNFFSNYDFSLGLGANLPIGQGLNFYPTSIFSFNYKLFIITSTILNFYIQYYFFLRLLNVLNISIDKIYIFFLNFLLLSTYTNLAYTYFNDWISAHTLYSIFFGLIFYLIKYGIDKSGRSFNKFTLLFLVAFINSHLAYLLFFLFFLFLIVLLNIKKFKIKPKILILPIIVTLIICVPKVLELFIIYESSPNFDEQFQNFENIFYILFYPVNFILRICDYFLNSSLSYEIAINSFSLGYGPHLIFGLIISLILIIKKKSKLIFNLDKIYLGFFGLILFINFLPFGNYSLFFRDFLNITFLIILVFFLNQSIYKKFKNFILFILVLSNTLMFTESYRFLKFNDLGYKSKISNIEYSTEFKDYLNSISKKDEKFFRIYLSEKVFLDVNDKRNIFYKSNGILTPKDFTLYNLNILNVSLKNHLNSNLRVSNIIMRDEIYPINDEIENNFLMNFYQIKYLLIYETETKKINLSNFIEERSFVFDNKRIIILRNLNFGKNLLIGKKNNLKKCNEELIVDCLVDNQKEFEENDKVIISKILNNNIVINNTNKKNVKFVLPFVKNNFWGIDNKNLIYNKLKVIDLEPGEKILIKDKDFLSTSNKILMILTFIFFTYYIYFHRRSLIKLK